MTINKKFFYRTSFFLGTASLLTVLTFPVAAISEGESMFESGKYDCPACHKVDSKLVGPSYKDIANKYRGDASAPAKLLTKVKEGGAGVWGEIPMAPHPDSSDDDLKKIITWILSLH